MSSKQCRGTHDHGVADVNALCDVERDCSDDERRPLRKLEGRHDLPVVNL